MICILNSSLDSQTSLRNLKGTLSHPKEWGKPHGEMVKKKADEDISAIKM